ncbi:hypothetical protein VTG60DRAFT_4664 [Thermothelomyces hinnuleus]
MRSSTRSMTCTLPEKGAPTVHLARARRGRSSRWRECVGHGRAAYPRGDADRCRVIGLLRYATSSFGGKEKRYLPAFFRPQRQTARAALPSRSKSVEQKLPLSQKGKGKSRGPQCWNSQTASPRVSRLYPARQTRHGWLARPCQKSAEPQPSSPTRLTIRRPRQNGQLACSRFCLGRRYKVQTFFLSLP